MEVYYVHISIYDWQEDDDITEVGDQDEWMNAKTMVKPEDQLQLTETVSILCLYYSSTVILTTLFFFGWFVDSCVINWN